MKTCHTCIHFRPYRPLSQLLGRDLGVDHPQLLTELTKLMQDERQKQDAEASQKIEIFRLDQPDACWHTKPQMSDYCGLDDEHDIHRFHEIKNARGDCEQHQPIITHPCASCSQRRLGEGEQKDQQMIDRLGQLAVNAVALGQNGGEQALTRYMDQIGVRKAFEATQAYYAGKIAFRPPLYLPVCAKFSSDTDFVPCAVQNPHDRCREHSGQTTPSQSSGMMDAIRAYRNHPSKDRP